MTGASDILELVDTAEPFEEQPAALDADAMRKFGLAELDLALAGLRAAASEARAPALDAAAQRVGQLIGAGALHQGFARALLEQAARDAGLIGELGLKDVKAAISAALKRGETMPLDTDAMRRAAAPAKQRRARDSAADRISSPSDASAASVPSDPPAAAAGAAQPSQPLQTFPAGPAAAAIDADDSADDRAAPPPRAPAPPAEGEQTECSQTGGSSPAVSDGGRGGTGGPPDDDDDGDDDRLNMQLAFYPLTDLGNAERFRERYRDRLLYCPALGWLVWDGRRWSRDGGLELVAIAEHDTVRAIQREADAVRESGRYDVQDAPRGARDFLVDVKKDRVILYSDKIANWGRSSESANKLGAISRRAAPYFAVSIDKLDADPFKVSVGNGTLMVDRKAAKSDRDVISFKPHDPKDLITKVSPVTYDPAATCAVYDATIARLQPDATMRRFLAQWFGLSLTGDVSEQKLVFLYGKGRNGKSTIVDIISYIAGDYGETVPIETFLDHGKARSGGQATPDLALLPGVRMLRTSEAEKGSKLAESLIKLATGGEPIQARNLNRDFFKFYPQFKLTMSGNYRPQISGTDEGIWRRMRLVPFAVTIAREDVDTTLGDKLRGEASGILNRLLDGLRDWCDHGLTEPEEVAKATQAYREDSDPLGRFLSTCVISKPGVRVQSSVMHAVFVAWCKTSGEREWTQKGFSSALKERGYQAKQSNAVWWLDVELIKTERDFVDQDGHARTMSAAPDDMGGADDPLDAPF